MAFVPPYPIPSVPKTLFTRLKVEVAETVPELFACRNPAPVPRVRLVVEALAIHAVVAVNRVAVAFPHDCNFVHVLLSVRRVVDAESPSDDAATHVEFVPFVERI